LQTQAFTEFANWLLIVPRNYRQYNFADPRDCPVAQWNRARGGRMPVSIEDQLVTLAADYPRSYGALRQRLMRAIAQWQ
jgi:hypothetical protein